MFTSDHGDYPGNNWLGEKELFHERSVWVLLIIVDPWVRADSTRGTECHTPVGAIDLVPTFLDATGAPVPYHRLSDTQGLTKGALIPESGL